VTAWRMDRSIRDEKTSAFLAFCERGYTGPRMDKDAWDVDRVVMTTRDKAAAHGLGWDRNVVIPEDDGLLSALFEASRDLLVETGVYNMTTGRVVELSRAEIDEGLSRMPQTLVMGEGADAYTLVARRVEDPRLPAVWAGNPGCPTPESLFLPIARSIVKEPVVDLLTCGSLVDVDGYGVRKGDPTEIMAVTRETHYLRMALEEAGRPGMGILGAESSTSEVGDFSAMRPDLLRRSDSHLVAMFNELIIDQSNLVRATAGLQYGIRNASLACTMVGGLGGDAPGSTLVMMASMMAANLVYAADYHLCHPIHVNNVATTDRGCLWLQSALCQAFAVKSPAIMVCDIWPKSGALTREILYEVAANSIVVAVSGGHLEGVGSADGRLPNGTGLEARLMGEVGKAVTRQGMTRGQANDLVLALLAKYEHVFTMPGGNPGRRFDAAYDMETIEPVPEWEGMYSEVKAELGKMGIRFA
jgi:methylamine--corrinoid protein Co-methyltransferase